MVYIVYYIVYSVYYIVYYIGHLEQSQEFVVSVFWIYIGTAFNN